ncbi:type I polyketide synthase [Streptomyces iconiensis]|uniref:SDR family NAD(P)-dependent oxidoreductase n=1 Tax=Streptomyces iconiensis TaxID=1384038 RepID=A0ABT7A621_9ACTN|nr:type I polyketide synthase [Streptomyces iconiensis]MDJ1136789.1 SDR family NAD(P)-dependent oxidoreductase [Streptomyces iconiensis]
MNGKLTASTERAIAVVGVACRLPGGITGLGDLWNVLQERRDVVGQVPEDRFEVNRFVDTSMPRTGKSYTAAGGFLDDIAGFDASYFGISPKEAAHMDPQHRLLLELTAEALDDAAIDPGVLAGSDTGVYVGISDASYGGMQMASLRTVNAYTMSGAASSIAANRLSHAFDLRGPSMAIDTACSSSLLALDQACRALWTGTSRTALCGGANILLSPFHYVGFSQASMLSLRGKCAAFSAQADGFVRAEGGGVVLLKRLNEALADGDRVHGVILGSASNSDGRTMGLSLPNLESQEDLLRQVYADAGVHPDELVYFEAHGTGTLVGDPMEAHAIGRALGIRRITGELPIGSVKSNVGHLEPASGMAGLCKALLVLKHRAAPASLHTDPPHPEIDFAGLGLSVASEQRVVPATERPVVGVNSFGFGGANAHAILTCAPELPAPVACDPPPEGLPVLVSARSARALSDAVVKMAARLEGAAQEEFYDIAYTSCLRRGKHEHRAAVLAHTPQEAARELSALGTETAARPDGTPEGQAPATAAGATAAGATAEAVNSGQVAFVFAGNGSQWAGMGADLLAQDSVFRDTVATVDTEMAPYLGWSVAEELAASPAGHRLSATEVAQPLLFAVQLGVVEVLRSQGVKPSMVIGHSGGEVAAAYASGALSLAQAAQVMAERSRILAATAGSGRMAAVGLPAHQAAEELAPYGGRLEIAGVNSHSDVTVTGDAEALAALGEELQQRGVFFRDLDLDYAFHSRAMDSCGEALTTALAGLVPGQLTVPLYSTVTGVRVRGSDLDARYWQHNMRRPVQFASAVERAMDDGGDIFLEIGPHPVLRSYLRRIATGRPGPSVAVLPTLRRDSDGPRALNTALTALIASGAAIEWERYFRSPGRVADLPAYPWQREKHWSGTPQSWVRSGGSGIMEHPLLGERLTAPLPVWEGAVEPAVVPWLTDHRVAGSVVMPATGYAEMALAAGRATSGGPVEVERLDISSALVVPWADASAVRLQVSLTPDDGTVTITSADDRAEEPRPHARGRVRSLLRPRPAPLDLERLRKTCTRWIEGEEHYRACAVAGLGYGPGFQVLQHLQAGEGAVVAAYRHDAPGGPYTVHPALLDGALQAGAPLMAESLADGHAYLPTAIGAVRVWSTPATTGAVWVRQRSRTGDEVCWDITLTDEDGTVTVELSGCRLRRLAAGRRTPVTTHHTVLRAAPHTEIPCPPSPLPSPARITAAAQERIAELRTEWRQMGYGRYISLSKKIAAHRLAGALASLLPDPAGPFSMDDLVTAGMRDQHRRLIRLVVPSLERHGVLALEDDGRWRLTTTDFAAEPLSWSVVTADPGFVTELSLGAHLVRSLPEVLRGTIDPTEPLVSETAAPALEQFYDTAPVCRFHNRIAQALLSEMVSNWPADRPLRVLEVGAGTGGGTAALLPLLPADRTRYCFTDVSPFFFSRAQKRFAAHDFVEYRTLDLDLDPLEQGYSAQGFDLVVAVNSLHTAKDLHTALTRIGTLLAPGGQLLISETHDSESLVPYFGALDSFHAQTDTDLRPDSVLLAGDQWPPLLERCGYTGVVRTGDDEAPACDDYSVLLAAIPADRSQAAPATPAARTGTAFVVAAETPQEEPLTHAVADTLSAGGNNPVRGLLAGTDPGDWESLLDIADGTSGTGAAVETVSVVLVLADTPQADPEALVQHGSRRGDLLRAVADVCRRLPQEVSGELWLVTRAGGAVPDPGEITHPADAIPWAVARCLPNEYPGLQSRRVCLHRSADIAADARRLVRELLTPTDEEEIVLASGGRFVPREKKRTRARAVTGNPSFALKVRNPGLTYELAWEETASPEPGPGQVVLDVRAAALNYRDMLQTVGMLPAEVVEGTMSQEGLGFECAGVVLACGAGVTGLRPGDRVAGVATACLASRTVASAQAVRRIPDHLTYAEAATAPVAFATVHYSLGHLARLRPGETVLVHGAAGGVGMAAVQYARAHGAQVIATAGNDLKRDFLRQLGVRHVLDSRSLEFASQVMDITEGQGVDIVLNSLAGEAITRSLELLRPGGRFLELGKRDIYENKPLLLGPFANNIAFYGVDLTKLLEDPQQALPLLAEIDDLMLAGKCHPLPHSVFPAARVGDAFRLMQHSRHIGKVVVAFDPLDEPVPVEHAPVKPRLDPEATYLVTGGTSGFGAATAEWLATLGARHLALVSRRGAEAPDSATVLARLADRGIDATAYAADASDLEAMRGVVDKIDAGGHPVRGVVHCAMHLDDALLADLDHDRFAAVLAPKAGGAAVADTLLRGRECDLFLLYSSTAALVGNLKQAPYCAGNLYLEALARRRSRRGDTGLAIAWGTIGDTGYVARNGLEDLLRALGYEPIDPHEAFAAAEGLLSAHADVAGALRCDWARGGLIAFGNSPRLSDLITSRSEHTGPSRDELIRSLGQMSPEDAVACIAQHLTTLLAEVLQMEPERLDHHRRIDEYGLDSLMATELLVSLQHRFDIDIPPMELLRSNGTIAELAQIIHLRLGLAQTTGTVPLPGQPAPAPSPVARTTAKLPAQQEAPLSESVTG